MTQMKSALLRVAFIALCTSLMPPALAEETKAEPGAKPPAPKGIFDKEIEAYEARDAKTPPPEGAIVCVGSSSMRLWKDSIQKDLAPLTLIP